MCASDAFSQRPLEIVCLCTLERQTDRQTDRKRDIVGLRLTLFLSESESESEFDSA